MKCPQCGAGSRVLETRDVRRRRACEACGHRFITQEVLIGAAVLGRPKAAPQMPTAEQIADRAKARTEARRKVEDMKEKKRAAWDTWSPDNDFIPEKW